MGEVKKLYEENPPYDYSFSTGEDRLYCLEFVKVVLKHCNLEGKLLLLKDKYPDLLRFLRID